MLELTEAEKRFRDWPVRKSGQMKRCTTWSDDGHTIMSVRYGSTRNDWITIKRDKDAARYIVDISEFGYNIDEEMMDIFKALIDEIKEANGDGRD